MGMFWRAKQESERERDSEKMCTKKECSEWKQNERLKDYKRE